MRGMETRLSPSRLSLSGLQAASGNVKTSPSPSMQSLSSRDGNHTFGHSFCEGKQHSNDVCMDGSNGRN